MPRNFIRLNDISNHSGNQFLFDICGLVVGCSPLRKIEKSVATNGKKTINEWSIREIKIKDETETTMKVILWEEHALKFDPSQIVERSVLDLSFASVYFYRGELCVSTRPVSQVVLDSSLPEVIKLKSSNTPVIVEDMVDCVEVAGACDWRHEEKKTVANILAEYTERKIQNEDVKFLRACEATVSSYSGKLGYRACQECFRRVTLGSGGTISCRKCGDVQRTFVAYNVDVELGDDTGTIIATIFASHVAEMLNLDIYDLDTMRQNDLNLDEIFIHHLVGRIGLFLLKVTTYENDMSVSVSKFDSFDENDGDEIIGLEENNKKDGSSEEMLVRPNLGAVVEGEEGMAHDIVKDTPYTNVDDSLASSSVNGDVVGNTSSCQVVDEWERQAAVSAVVLNGQNGNNSKMSKRDNSVLEDCIEKPITIEEGGSKLRVVSSNNQRRTKTKKG